MDTDGGDNEMLRTLAVQPVKGPDPGDLRGRPPDLSPAAWIHRGDGLVGWGEAARVTIPAGADRFAVGEQWLANLVANAEITDDVGLPGTGLVAFGSFTFDPAAGGSILTVPGTIVARRAGVAWLTTITPDSGPPPVPPS